MAFPAAFQDEGLFCSALLHVRAWSGATATASASRITGRGGFQSAMVRADCRACAVRDTLRSARLRPTADGASHARATPPARSHRPGRVHRVRRPGGRTLTASATDKAR